ncbi:MAG TPA: hypothetical protein VFB74_31490 [Kribbellaceae bacterium]|nr:hypothetical protein [Kribbellaceae bacterium]
MTDRTAVTLRLTDAERTALTALAAGMGGVNESVISEEDAVVGAIELALTRLVDDFEIPDAAVRAQVETARNTLRSTWTRGSSSL